MPRDAEPEPLILFPYRTLDSYVRWVSRGLQIGVLGAAASVIAELTSSFVGSVVVSYVYNAGALVLLVGLGISLYATHGFNKAWGAEKKRHPDWTGSR